MSPKTFAKLAFIVTGLLVGIFILLLAMSSLTGCSSVATPTQTPQANATATIAPTDTPVVRPSPVPTKAPTQTPLPTPTQVFVPTQTPSPIPTEVTSPTQTPTQIPRAHVYLIIAATDFVFTPANITIDTGIQVTLTLKNNGAIVHDWHVELSRGELHVIATAKSENSIEFTLNRPGTYEIICTLPGHKDAGMHGTLTVIGPDRGDDVIPAATGH